MRGEAASGFPTIFEYGLPTLVNRQGATQNDRQLEALLVMARHTEDSTLIKRAGDPAILKWKDQQLDHLFDLGELGTSEGLQFLTALETTFSASHLSLGGRPTC
ncbi:triphosphoribosyl-dephospho-CoA synthase [Limosilactobacillus fermentum]|uniref:triphosphoribosyl-dephospho-CoA synthase n=1 Tax=Limosilactobacillus fermentum TaxID=1613 RepID=UPI0030021C9B